VLGYRPNHRATEDLLDAGGPVKAVVTWMISIRARDRRRSWLGASPLRTRERAALRRSFNDYHWVSLAGLKYLLGEQFLFVDAIGMRQRQEEQADLFVALMVRLQQLSREKFGAPLIVVYSWPDDVHRKGYGDAEFLIGVLNRLRQAGIALLSVDNLRARSHVQLLIPTTATHGAGLHLIARAWTAASRCPESGPLRRAACRAAHAPAPARRSSKTRGALLPGAVNQPILAIHRISRNIWIAASASSGRGRTAR
jgi:hypothetical protein